MSSEKFALVLDTNLLYTGENAKNDFSELALDLYYKSMNIIELNDITDLVNIFIPEIVLLEHTSHTLDKIKDKIVQLKELSEEFDRVPEITINVHDTFDPKTHIDALKRFALNNVNYIEIPEDWSTLFNSVLEMALYKIPPFEKGKGKSDKGFKDAIILLSLIEFAKIEEYTHFVIFSEDKAFKNNEGLLNDFFNKETGKHLEIQRHVLIQDYISKKFNLSFDNLKQYLNDYYYLEIEKEINQFKAIFLEEYGQSCDIESIEIDLDKTSITQINPDEYDLSVTFKVNLDREDLEIKEINDLKRVYSFKNEDGEWKIKKNEFNYKIT